MFDVETVDIYAKHEMPNWFLEENEILPTLVQMMGIILKFYLHQGRKKVTKDDLKEIWDIYGPIEWVSTRRLRTTSVNRAHYSTFLFSLEHLLSLFQDRFKSHCEIY